MRRSSVVLAITAALVLMGSPADAKPRACKGPRPEMGMTGNALYDEACSKWTSSPWKRNSRAL